MITQPRQAVNGEWRVPTSPKLKLDFPNRRILFNEDIRPKFFMKFGDFMPFLTHERKIGRTLSGSCEECDGVSEDI